MAFTAGGNYELLRTDGTVLSSDPDRNGRHAVTLAPGRNAEAPEYLELG